MTASGRPLSRSYFLRRVTYGVESAKPSGSADFTLASVSVNDPSSISRARRSRAPMGKWWPLEGTTIWLSSISLAKRMAPEIGSLV